MLLICRKKAGGEALMGFSLTFLVILISLPVALPEEINLVVNGTYTVAETDESFICATIDWWPDDTCRFNICMLQNSSAITLDLSNLLLAKTIQAFKYLRLRIGGSLQDQLIYNTGCLRYPCNPFEKSDGGLFDLTNGCLYMKRWDELNQFFNKTRAIVTFGLNALYGRQKQDNSTLWVGDWDSSNAKTLLSYTVSKGYEINSWEFGNELSGSGVAARVEAAQYARDVLQLKEVINEVYKNSCYKPKLAAPGGFFDEKWYAELLKESGMGIIDVVTHHTYNLGRGDDLNIISKILDPSYSGRTMLETFKNMERMIQEHAPWASSWVGESGGVFQGGAPNVSDRFVNSFWYLDQLGMAAKYSTKVFCRQTLVGGHYALLNRTTLEPNPDYYSALLWHRLMGKGVLQIDSDGSSFLRAYAHCSKGRDGVTLLLINFSNHTKFKINVYSCGTLNLHGKEENIERESCSMHREVQGGGKYTWHRRSSREEYHLTPKDGNLKSQTSVLNGDPLEVKNGEIPKLDPVLRKVNAPIRISPLSIAFIVIPNFEVSACSSISFVP